MHFYVILRIVVKTFPTHQTMCHKFMSCAATTSWATRWLIVYLCKVKPKAVGFPRIAPVLSSVSHVDKGFT
jgi:hypothetical protein